MKLIMMKSLSQPVSQGYTKAKNLTDINNITRNPISRYLPKGEFLYDEALWPVLISENDQNKSMMKKIFDAVKKACCLSSRLFTVRYDLHLNEIESDNRIIDRFHRDLFRQLNKQYPKSFKSYVWVREKNIAEAPHYHYALMMDGNYIRHPSKLTQIVQKCWMQVAGGRSVWIPENCYYFLKSEDSYELSQLMLRLSYFGKRQTKETSIECRKRFGCGLRKPKSKNKPKCSASMNNSTVSSDLSPDPILTATKNSITTNPHDSIDYDSKLNLLFFGDLDVDALKPLPKEEKTKNINDLICNSIKNYRTNPLNYFRLLCGDKRPDWQWHRLNYIYEVISNGISLAEYSKKYKLKLKRVYANFRKIGGQSLQMLHWAWHRRMYLRSNLPVSDYILRTGLKKKSSIRQLQRQPMSVYWREHFEHYYRRFWPLGWTVSAYCDVHHICVHTARRYLVNIPKTALFNPLALASWL